MAKGAVSERFRQAFDFLKKNGYGKSDVAIAALIGLTNRSYVSQMLTGKRPIAADHLINLCLIDPRLNFQWLVNGKGRMIVDDNEKHGPPPNTIDDEKTEKHPGMTTTMLIRLLYDSNQVNMELRQKIRELEAENERLKAPFEKKETSTGS